MSCDRFENQYVFSVLALDRMNVVFTAKPPKSQSFAKSNEFAGGKLFPSLAFQAAKSFDNICFANFIEETFALLRVFFL